MNVYKGSTCVDCIKMETPNVMTLLVVSNLLDVIVERPVRIDGIPTRSLLHPPSTFAHACRVRRAT